MSSFSSTIQLISIWGIIVPLVVGFVYFKKAEFQFRLFVFFLLIGFCTDIVMYSLQFTPYKYLLPKILNVYSLIEASLFFWFIMKNSKQQLIVRLAKVLLMVTPVFWTIIVAFRPGFITSSASQSFDPFYEVCVAFFSGFILLQLVEEKQSVNELSIFWIFVGMFFYCFCTFFIMGFLNTLFSQKIWFINNIINIITYIFYSVGLWKLRKSN